MQLPPSDTKKLESVNIPPFEAEELRQYLSKFLDTNFPETVAGKTVKVGNFKWGVYAFFDYDGEPIYIGQTNEKLRTRIRRHLTNQRTDAVAMSVLDPFEVREIEVWPLLQFQKTDSRDKDAKAHLDALERLIYEKALSNSRFSAVLNEKDPPITLLTIDAPPSFRGYIVSDEVYRIRSHLDYRLARRAMIIARLAQVISERKVQGGLRRVLLTQAKRLQYLAERRYLELGGDASVEREDEPNHSGDDG
ncbi:MAG: catalytic protein [Pseudomonadota bacterium]|nr:catalytic protein [Pseudomonadota bacterium]